MRLPWQKRDAPEEVKEEKILDGDLLLRAILGNETITREKALTLPAVSGAVDFIASTIASMPIKLYKRSGGMVESRDDDDRVRLLNTDTEDTLDAYQLKRAIVADYLLDGNGYIYIRRNRNVVTGLYYVNPCDVNVVMNENPIYKNFSINISGRQYRPFEFVKVLRNTTDGATGTGLTEEVAKALETAYRTLLYQLGLVKSGGNKKGFLKSQKRLDAESITALKTAWRNLYANDTENVVVLNNGIEFQESSNSSVEMQLNESKRTLQDEINSIFHIYPGNFELTFKCAIYPILRAIETALNRDLLTEREARAMFFEFDVKETLRASLTERYSAYRTAKETGFMTLNEIRRAENMNDIEGLDVINVGLSAVLYDTNTHTYYTPNTGETKGGELDGDQNQTEFG